MMLPILISVSVAPVSYFFWAIAPVLVAANTIMVADSTCSRSRKAGMMNLFRSVASVRFDDLVRPFLVANDLTDAIVIAVDGLVHHDKLFAASKRYASPNIWARIKARSLEERTGCSMDSVEFMFLFWLTDLPAWGCVKSRKSARPFQPGNKIKQCRRMRPDMSSLRPTIWPSSNSHHSAFGYALMSPQPNRIMTSSLCLSMISGQTLSVCPEADHALCVGRRSDKSKLRPFTLGKLRDGLAEDKFLEMLGLLVGCERGFRRKYFVEEELLRFGYALMNLEFLHARFFPRLGKKFSQQACNGILLARLGFPKCGNDETLVGAIRIHGLSPSMLTSHSPQGAIRRRLARPLVRMLRCAPNQRHPKQAAEVIPRLPGCRAFRTENPKDGIFGDGGRFWGRSMHSATAPPGRVCALAPQRQAA